MADAWRRYRQACALTCAVEFADLVASTIIVRFVEREDAGDLLPSPMPGVSPAALEQERTSLRARRAAQLRRHAGGIEDGELKASMETFTAREAAIAAELAPTGEHSPLAGIAGRPDAAQIRDGLPLGLTRQVIRACCQVLPAGFIAGTTAETYDPELITSASDADAVHVHRAATRHALRAHCGSTVPCTPGASWCSGGHVPPTPTRCCENFLYVFKGAPSAPRAWRRLTAARHTAGKLSHAAESGRDAPVGNPPTTQRPLALPRQRTAAAARSRTPSSSPHRLGAESRRALRERGHPPGAVIVEADQDHGQGRLCSQDNR